MCARIIVPDHTANDFAGIPTQEELDDCVALDVTEFWLDIEEDVNVAGDGPNGNDEDAENEEQGGVDEGELVRAGLEGPPRNYWLRDRDDGN